MKVSIPTYFTFGQEKPQYCIKFHGHSKSHVLSITIGGAGVAAGGGGGSGGSILLNTTYLHGDGTIDVSGGDGNTAKMTAWHRGGSLESFHGKHCNGN